MNALSNGKRYRFSLTPLKYTILTARILKEDTNKRSRDLIRQAASRLRNAVSSMQAGGGEAGRHVHGDILNGTDVLFIRGELAVARHPNEVSVLVRRPLVLRQKISMSIMNTQ